MILFRVFDYLTNNPKNAGCCVMCVYECCVCTVTVNMFADEKTDAISMVVQS